MSFLSKFFSKTCISKEIAIARKGRNTDYTEIIEDRTSYTVVQEAFPDTEIELNASISTEPPEIIILPYEECGKFYVCVVDSHYNEIISKFYEVTLHDETDWTGH